MSRPRTRGGVALACAALLFVAGWFAGNEHAAEKQHAALSAAQVDAALWQSTATGQQGAITNLKLRAQHQQEDLNNVRAIADAVLNNRDALQLKYDKLRLEQQNANTKAAHENPDCADLTRPLCPAVAGRLFRPPGNDAAGDH